MFVAGYSMASFAILVSHTMPSMWCEEEAYCVIKRNLLLLLEITLRLEQFCAEEFHFIWESVEAFVTMESPIQILSMFGWRL